jgi:hypothetical protein
VGHKAKVKAGVRSFVCAEGKMVDGVGKGELSDVPHVRDVRTGADGSAHRTRNT